MTGNFFSYARISTKESDDKQSFNRQLKAFERFEQENGIEFLRHFQDDCSGKSFDRKSWQTLESAVRRGDTIVFKEVSRFTRQAECGLEKYLGLMNDGVNLMFLDNPTVNTDYIKQLSDAAKGHDLIIRKSIENVIQLLLIVELDRCEKERETIVRRIKQGIASSEKTQGRKKGEFDKLTTELSEDIRQYLTDRTISQTSLMEKHGISRNTLKTYIRHIKSRSLESMIDKAVARNRKKDNLS